MMQEMGGGGGGGGGGRGGEGREGALEHHLGALSALSEEIRPLAPVRVRLRSFCKVGWTPGAAVGDKGWLTCPLNGSAAHSKHKSIQAR